MLDMMTCMERVANTPIPRSYSIHLKQCVSLYLFVLPFVLVKELGWGMVPVVTVVAFTLMGIEGIADEIEMPFGASPSPWVIRTRADASFDLVPGLDKSDLPLGELELHYRLPRTTDAIVLYRTLLRRPQGRNRVSLPFAPLPTRGGLSSPPGSWSRSCPKAGKACTDTTTARGMTSPAFRKVPAHTYEHSRSRIPMHNTPE